MFVGFFCSLHLQFDGVVPYHFIPIGLFFICFAIADFYLYLCFYFGIHFFPSLNSMWMWRFSNALYYAQHIRFITLCMLTARAPSPAASHSNACDKKCYTYVVIDFTCERSEYQVYFFSTILGNVCICVIFLYLICEKTNSRICSHTDEMRTELLCTEWRR